MPACQHAEFQACSSYLAAWHAFEGASIVGQHNGGDGIRNGDGDVGREIAKATCGAGAWGDSDSGQDERDAAAKIFSKASGEHVWVRESAARARVWGWCPGRHRRRCRWLSVHRSSSEHECHCEEQQERRRGSNGLVGCHC